MFLDRIFLFIGTFVFSYFTWILESLGYPGITFGEAATAPWFVQWPIFIWVAVTMFVSIIMMIKGSVRLIKNIYNILIQSSGRLSNIW